LILVHLGCCDTGVSVDWTAWLRAWNPPVGGRAFREERLGKWRRPKTLPGSPVAELQAQLRALGFLPFGPIDGICGYRTRASIRLFQEYVFAIEGRPTIGTADGIVGKGVRTHLERWLAEGRTADWCDALGDHSRAIGGLIGLKAHFSGAGSSTPGIGLLTREPDKLVSASRPVSDWDFDPQKTHLIGVRRNVNQVRVSGTRHHRKLDDVFVLLVGGMRWTFLGSTDPMIGERSHKPFLLRGQHHYATQWHNITDEEKVYRAWKPRADGVLIVRSGGRDGLLEDNDYDVPSAEVNPSINVHWSGIGTANWSAGCQVIAGAKYIDFRGETIDCNERAAAGYSTLSGKRTKGAYNVLCDLITVFSPDASIGGDGLLYTLLFEDDLSLGGPAVLDAVAAVEALSM
jgi:hypothetical protein